MKDEDFIISKTDTTGKITYCNQIFMEMSVLPENELLGKPHSIIRHPDMPKAVFKLLWERIDSGKEVFAYVKNLSADGSFYWVFANVTPSYDITGKIIGHYSVRRKPNPKALEIIKPLYEEMLRVEKSEGMNASMNYLTKQLEKEEVSYDELIANIQD
ncbi:MAG: PAS domain-containing protein [Epsilonproteobacteria bacterium]|nr:PAS domain-containing protein [Campylobacterota bacterium]